MTEPSMIPSSSSNHEQEPPHEQHNEHGQSSSATTVPLVDWKNRSPTSNSHPTVKMAAAAMKRKTSSMSRHNSESSGPPPPPSSSSSAANNRFKVYPSHSRGKWVTREIAALEFLLGIHLEAEEDIVRKGWMQQQGIAEDPHKKREFEDDDDDGKVEVLEPPSHLLAHGRWWEKWVKQPELISKRSRVEDEDLEQPNEMGMFRSTSAQNSTDPHGGHPSVPVPVVHAPGRRLQGEEATKVQVPFRDEKTVLTRQKNVAQMAFTREWELKLAHGIGDITNMNSGDSKTSLVSSSQRQVRPPMLDGRLFFSAGESYPVQVFSVVRYEPKREEAARRRQKLEARGGGGTQFFIMPFRDWRGISYRALLPTKKTRLRPKQNEEMLVFDRFASPPINGMEGSRSNNSEVNNRKSVALEEFLDSEDDDESTETVDEDTYVVGLLDDPGMVQGRHRNVMIGDRVSGPIISSTIQFVKPELLKADLNNQFRERFDGWEPPKSQRKYIGARVVDGIYTLMDPGTAADDASKGIKEEDSQQAGGLANGSTTPRNRQGSISSLSTAGGAETKETIRMPPSLTLSKIRSIKHQALLVAVQAKLEISTVALAIIYFERLCLDCRVDKTNRRLSFAACLMLSVKMNEAHVELLIQRDEEFKTTTSNRIQSLIKPSKKSGNVFASLLEFFTQEWNLSLKHLYAAEWGVFAALQFRLHAKPSQVAFHFKRLLKALDWNPRVYLGPQMYAYWIDSLSEEEYERSEREARRKARLERKERKKLLQLQRELDAANRSEAGSARNMGSEAAREQTQERQQPMKPALAEEMKLLEDGEPLEKVTAKAGEFSPVVTTPKKVARGSGFGRILTHFAGGKRTHSSNKLSTENRAHETSASLIPLSPSMPSLPTTAAVPMAAESEHHDETIEELTALSPDIPRSERESEDEDESSVILV